MKALTKVEVFVALEAEDLWQVVIGVFIVVRFNRVLGFTLINGSLRRKNAESIHKEQINYEDNNLGMATRSE